MNEGALVAAVEAIYAAAPDPSLWPQAFQAMADVVGGMGGVLLWQRDDGSFGTVVSPSLEAAQKDYAENGWSRRDLPAIRALERGLWLAADIVTDRAVVSDEEMASDPFYAEFKARHDLGWMIAMNVAPHPHLATAISLHRRRGQPPYTEAEIAAVARLCRHAEKALRLSMRLLDSELSNIGMREALTRLGIAVFALDSLGRVVFANEAGERLIGHGLEIVNGRLRAGMASARLGLDKATTRALAGDARALISEPKPILVERTASPRPLAVYLLPIVAPVSADFLTHARAIVLAIDPQAHAPPDPAVVRDVLGLTLGEARVAALIGSGLPPRETAAKLGVSEETARTALKRVFSKVGVSRQSELAALLTRLVLR